MKCNLSQLFFILYVTGKLCSPHLKLSLIEREIQVDQSVGNYSFQFFQRSNPTYNWTNPQITVKWLKCIQSLTLANTCDLCTLTILGSPHIENGKKNRQCLLWATPPHDLFIKQPYADLIIKQRQWVVSVWSFVISVKAEVAWNSQPC